MTLKHYTKPEYPVLSALTKDYATESQYRADYIVRLQAGKNITIAVKHQVVSQGLQELLDNGTAAYGLHIHCRATRRRALLTTNQPNQTVALLDQDYAARTTIRGVIIATTEIAGWDAPDWSEDTKWALDYGPASVPQGGILASARAQSFKTTDLESGDSIVQMIPSDSAEEGRNHIDLSQHKIIIRMRPELYQELMQLKEQNKAIADALWASIYLPAIQQAVRRHRDDDCRDKRWATNVSRRMQQKLTELGEAIPDDELLQADDYRYAQMLMDNPIPKLLSLKDRDEEPE